MGFIINIPNNVYLKVDDIDKYFKLFKIFKILDKRCLFKVFIRQNMHIHQKLIRLLNIFFLHLKYNF